MLTQIFGAALATIVSTAAMQVQGGVYAEPRLGPPAQVDTSTTAPMNTKTSSINTFKSTWTESEVLRPNKRSVNIDLKFGKEARVENYVKSYRPVVEPRSSKIKDRTGTNANTNRSQYRPRQAEENSVQAKSQKTKKVLPVTLVDKKKTGLTTENSIYSQDITKIRPWDHVRGNRNANVSMIVYTDLECPFCQRFHPTIKQAVDMYGQRVNWVYRPFPLEIHDNAHIAAVGAECSADLGGDASFWKFIDIVNKEGVSEEVFLQIAPRVGLDTTNFLECLKRDTFDERIKTSVSEGKEMGITGTPWVIVVNHKTGTTTTIQGAQPFGAVKDVVDAVLN